ncbi:ArsR family transcriptional regulator [Streptomyces tauricus]
MILQRLAGGEARVVDLTTAMGMAQSSVSAHLAVPDGESDTP